MDILKSDFDYSYEKILSSINRKEILIPLKVFKTKLSPAESLVKYLKENCNLKLSQIAALINRDQRGIWLTYNNSVKKHKQLFIIQNPKYLIPISIFSNRKLSILENLVFYLIKTYNLTIKQITELLTKKSSTIWSIKNRIKTKLKTNE